MGCEPNTVAAIMANVLANLLDSDPRTSPIIIEEETKATVNASRGLRGRGYYSLQKWIIAGIIPVVGRLKLTMT